MSLEKLEGINRTTILALSKKGWTVDKLATANPIVLAKIPGVGLKTAGAVIDTARNIVNTEKLAKAAKIEFAGVVDEPVQRSVRVRRIYGETV